MIAASAIGSFIGSLIGGFLADDFGLNAVNRMATVAAGLSVVVLWIWLTPIERGIADSENLDPAGAES